MWYNIKGGKNMDFLTVKEACEYLCLSASKVNVLMKQKKLPFYKLEGKVLLKKEDLNNYIESCRRS